MTSSRSVTVRHVLREQRLQELFDPKYKLLLYKHSVNIWLREY